MTNRFHRAIKTTTFSVGDFAYESRRQGAPSITSTVFGFEGMPVFVEETLGGLIDLQKIQQWVERTSATGKIEMGVAEKQLAKQLLKTVIERLDAMGLDAGTLVSRVMMRFPDLIAKLLLQGAVLQDGETDDDFLDWLDTLSFSEVGSLLMQWYRFNLEDLVGPFVRKAQEGAAQQPVSEDKPRPAARPKRMGLVSGSSKPGT